MRQLLQPESNSKAASEVSCSFSAAPHLIRQLIKHVFINFSRSDFLFKLLFHKVAREKVMLPFKRLFPYDIRICNSIIFYHELCQSLLRGIMGTVTFPNDCPAARAHNIESILKDCLFSSAYVYAITIFHKRIESVDVKFQPEIRITPFSGNNFGFQFYDVLRSRAV